MSPGILGKKIGMTQVFRPDGQVVPVTLLKAGPCMVVQRKTPATDGYDAVQLGLVEFIKPCPMPTSYDRWTTWPEPGRAPAGSPPVSWVADRPPRRRTILNRGSTIAASRR